jgi:hypothetical protein
MGKLWSVVGLAIVLTVATEARGASVAVWEPPAFVDSGGGAGDTSETIKASLTALGHQVSTFTGLSPGALSAGLAGKQALLIPELVFGGLDGTLLPAAFAVLLNFVGAGGGLILHGDGGDNAADFLRSYFFPLEAALDTSPVVGASSNRVVSLGHGTALVRGPEDLVNHAGTYRISGLPDGARDIYQVPSGGGTTVALIPFGLGRIVFLGWNWSGAGPLGVLDGGWLTVLDLAVHEVTWPRTLVTGTGVGGGSHVIAYADADHDGFPEAITASFLAADAGFLGGVRVASCDVTGDGVPDLVTGAGPGGGPEVRVFSGASGAALPGPLGSFFAYDPAFTGGVYVACGDVDGDGTPDIVTGAGEGGSPQVRVFSGVTGSQIAGPVGSFLPYSPGFTGGVRVAACNIDADGQADIVTGTGPGGAAHVQVFSSATGALVHPAWSFFAYDPGFTGGIYVACATLGDTQRFGVVTGAGAGGGPHVQAFRVIANSVPPLQTVASFFAYDAGFTGGVTVAAVDYDNDGISEIVTGTGAGGAPHVRVFDGVTLTLAYEFFAYDPGFLGGVFVGTGTP